MSAHRPAKPSMVSFLMATAKSCSHCMRPSLVGIALIVLCAALWPTDQAAGQDAAMKITAEELTKEFETDKDATTKKYEGKILEVEGILKVVNKEKGWASLFGFKQQNKGELDRKSIVFTPAAKSPALEQIKKSVYG